MFPSICIVFVLVSYLSTSINAALVCGAGGTLGILERFTFYVDNLEGCLNECLTRSECLSYVYAAGFPGDQGQCRVSAHTVAKSIFVPSDNINAPVVYDVDCDVPTTGTRPAQAAPTCGMCGGAGCNRKKLRRGTGEFASGVNVDAATPAECLAACRADNDGPFGCQAIFFSITDECLPFCRLLLGTEGGCEVDWRDSPAAYYDVNCPPDQLAYTCAGPANTCLPTSTSSSSTPTSSSLATTTTTSSSATSTSISSSSTVTVTSSLSTTSSASITKTHSTSAATSSTQHDTTSSVLYPAKSYSTISTEHLAYPSSHHSNYSAASYSKNPYVPQYWVSTIYGISLVTVTACPPSVYNCPLTAQHTSVVTKTVILGKTLCSLTVSATAKSKSEEPSYGSSAPTFSEPTSASSSGAGLPGSENISYGSESAATSPYSSNPSSMTIPGTYSNGTSPSPAQYTGAGMEAVAAQAGFLCVIVIAGALLL